MFKTFVSLLSGHASYKQPLKHRFASDLNVILCDKKINETCYLNCPSGAAILIHN